MKRKNSLIDLERLRNTEFRIVNLPAYFPGLPRERLTAEGVRLVFEGRLVPGTRPGFYRRPPEKG